MPLGHQPGKAAVADAREPEDLSILRRTTANRQQRPREKAAWRKRTALHDGPRQPRPGDPAVHPDQEVAVLLRLAPARRRAVQRLQPPLPPAPLRRPDRRVLAAA